MSLYNLLYPILSRDVDRSHCNGRDGSAQIHGLLQRASRLVFVLSGPPPAQASPPVLSNPLVAAALPNSTYLLAGWALLDGWVKLYPSQDKVTVKLE